MVVKINEYRAKKMMEDAGRDRFSIEALAYIIDYYDECGYDEPVVFDPICICCDWVEYTPEEFYNEYKEYIKDGMTDDQILETMNDEYFVVKLENDNFLISW